jgi:hypothetical protein
MTNLHNLASVLNEPEKAYLAGFIDGDGSINAQLVRRPEYKFKFQIRVTITLFQSTKRHWFLLQLKQRLQCGSVRKRNDGISEYSIVGIDSVAVLCKILLPYLRLKRRQAELVLRITNELSVKQTQSEFLSLCDIADHIGTLNDSKPRTITAAIIQRELEEINPNKDVP